MVSLSSLVSVASKHGAATSYSSSNPMRKLLYAICVVLITSLTCRAGSAEQEKAFTDKYKTAFEAKDTATLESFLYTQGADPMAIEFYKRCKPAKRAERFPRLNWLL
jgi:hypothetical protein